MLYVLASTSADSNSHDLTVFRKNVHLHLRLYRLFSCHYPLNSITEQVFTSHFIVLGVTSNLEAI